jgi:hypothetical protein
MASIPIDNETIYALTDAMRQHILRDAHEHFGDEVRSIRVQSGLERHAFNARTHAVRYAFSPQDFGFNALLATTPEISAHWADIPTMNDATEAEFIPAPFKDRATDEELEARETSMHSLEQERDEDEEKEDVFTLDDPHADEDEEDEHSVLDDDDENDEQSYAARERGTHMPAVTPQSVLDTRALADATGGVLRKEAREA